jgi:hypothetical protein
MMFLSNFQVIILYLNVPAKGMCLLRMPTLGFPAVY